MSLSIPSNFSPYLTRNTSHDAAIMPPHPDLLAKVSKVKAKYENVIKSLPGVRGVEIGSLLPDGEVVCGGPVGLVIYTRTKSAVNFLDPLISDTIEGVGVRFQAVEPIGPKPMYGIFP